MKAKISIEELQQAINSVMGLVTRKITKPTLSCLLFKVEKGELTITAGNGQQFARFKCSLFSGSEDGCIAVNAKKLALICKHITPDSIVELTQQDHSLLIDVFSGDNLHASIDCLPGEEFPEPDEFSPSLIFTIGPDELINVIQNTQMAMGVTDVRYYLNGAYWQPKPESNRLNVVCTNGHMMALSDCEVAYTKASDSPFIVPRQTILQILKIFGKTQASLTVSVCDLQMKVTNNRKTLVSDLTDGRFPDYSKAIPEPAKTLAAPAKRFKQMLDQASANTYKSRHNGIEINAKNGQLAVKSKIGLDSTCATCSTDYQGDELIAGFNVEYLKSIMNKIQSRNVLLSFKDDDGPVLIQSAMPETPKFVVMPMRL